MKTKQDNLKSLMVTLTIVVVAGLLTGALDALADEPSAASASLSKKVDRPERPPFYVKGMITGGVLFEDDDNRLTDRASTGLAGGGLALRTGGVIDDSHMLGILMQGYWRSTNAVLDEQDPDDSWGAISTYQIGPEYLYMTDFGLYLGANAGLAFTFADNDVGRDTPDCNTWDCVEDHMQESHDHAVVGFGARGTIGYEWRVNRWIGINVEAYGGVLIGEDEDRNEMTTPVFGMAMGVGI